MKWYIDTGLYWCKAIQGCRDTRLQGYKEIGIQGYRDTGIYRYRGIGEQGCEDTGLQGYGKTRIQGYTMPKRMSRCMSMRQALYRLELLLK